MATAQMSRFLRRLTRGMAAETLGELTDRQLLERLLGAQDEAVFEALVRRHGPMVYRVCWRVLQQAEDTEDAFQATFLLLARKLQAVRKRDSLASWLHGVAHRVALDAKARAARRRRHEARAATNSHPGPPEEITWRELRTVLDAELGRLPEKWRLPLILCYLEGRSQEEAARQLGWSKSTLLRRLEEARAALGRRLTRRGVVWPAALSAVLLSDCVASAALAPGLVGSTVEAAAQVAAGQAAAGIISVKVAALTEGVLKTMLLTKLKIAMAVVLAVGVVGAGASLMKLPAPAAEPPKTVRPVPKDGDKPVVVREDAALQGLAWSSDGEIVATAGHTHDGPTCNSTLKLWDARTGKLKRALDEEKDSLLKIAFSRDLLAVAVSGKLHDRERGSLEVRLLDAKTLELKHKIDETLVPGILSWTAIAFSPDGKKLALAGAARAGAMNSPEPFLKLWDVEKKRLIEINADFERVPSNTNPPRCLAFSPDGKVLGATCSIGAKIYLFDSQTAEFRTVLEPELKPESRERGLAGIAFSPDSKTLAILGGDDNTVVLWDLTEGKPRRPLKGHKGAVCAVAFSPDGKWIATSGRTAKTDYEVLLWDAKTGEVKQTFPGLTEWVHVVAFSPDGKTLAVCAGHSSGEKDNYKGTGEIRLLRLE